MKKHFVTMSVISLMAASGAVAQTEPAKICKETARVAGDSISSAIAKGANIVTQSQDAVSRAIEAHPECACEIIGEAVKAARGSTELITSIVEAALQIESVNRETILTCSLEAAPEKAHSAIYRIIGDSANAGGQASAGAASAVGAPLGAVVSGGRVAPSAATTAAVVAAANQVAVINEAEAASVAAVLIGGVAAPEPTSPIKTAAPVMSAADPVEAP